MSHSLRILLVDDQRLMREGLRTLLELEPDMAIVGEVGDGAAALLAYAEFQPDVVLMDIRMPVLDGVEATRQLCQQWPGAHILILTTFDDDAYVFEGLRAGALGYLLKDVSGQELANAVRTIAAGGAQIGPSVARKVLGELNRNMPATRPRLESPFEPLSEREQEILQLLAQGLSNPEIATKLHLAEGTIKNYVTNILQKTGSRDRTQAALWAKESGLI
ncbi:MAG: response regulator transcription factor [Chloroflexi bacterium]|nr:response regulator transcription factor [Chloroflexota bacterium]MBP8057618.1 response regulator transcription factor [Chloroflexota bacterium]